MGLALSAILDSVPGAGESSKLTRSEPDQDFFMPTPLVALVSTSPVESFKPRKSSDFIDVSDDFESAFWRLEARSCGKTIKCGQEAFETDIPFKFD